MASDGNYSADEAEGSGVAAAAKPTFTPASVISDEAWEAAVSAWLNTHIRNSPISGVTEAWNYLGSVLPQLRKELEDQLGRNS